MGRRRQRPVSATARSFGELEKWPQDALDYLWAEFRRKRVGAGKTYREILAEIQNRWGLGWNDSSMSRYYDYWGSTQYIEDRAREEADAIVTRLVAEGGRNGDLVAAAKQLFEERCLLALTRTDEIDPAAVILAAQRQQRIDQHGQKLDLDRGRKALLEEKVKIERGHLDLERRKVELRERASGVANRVEEKVKAAGKTLDPEVARMIREEVYGLSA